MNNGDDDDEKSSNEDNDKENLEKLKKLKEKLSRKGSRSEMEHDPDTGIMTPLLLLSRLSKTHFQVLFYDTSNSAVDRTFVITYNMAVYRWIFGLGVTGSVTIVRP